jgi:hypothetical protein
MERIANPDDRWKNHARLANFSTRSGADTWTGAGGRGLDRGTGFAFGSFVLATALADEKGGHGSNGRSREPVDRNHQSRAASPLRVASWRRQLRLAFSETLLMSPSVADLGGPCHDPIPPYPLNQAGDAATSPASFFSGSNMSEASDPQRLRVRAFDHSSETGEASTGRSSQKPLEEKALEELAHCRCGRPSASCHRC